MVVFSLECCICFGALGGNFGCKELEDEMNVKVGEQVISFKLVYKKHGSTTKSIGVFFPTPFQVSRDRTRVPLSIAIAYAYLAKCACSCGH